MLAPPLDINFTVASLTVRRMDCRRIANHPAILMEVQRRLCNSDEAISPVGRPISGTHLRSWKVIVTGGRKTHQDERKGTDGTRS